mmetsp:Transcript_84958/g.218848  ORF Transcript_84958/g.218848 Transcript_84958/m.218848 type:complete len:321 (-) Transcript_84958:24-986(-)
MRSSEEPPWRAAAAASSRPDGERLSLKAPRLPDEICQRRLSGSAQGSSLWRLLWGMSFDCTCSSSGPSPPPSPPPEAAAALMGLPGSRLVWPSPPKTLFSASATLPTSGASRSGWNETSRTAGQRCRRCGPATGRPARRENRRPTAPGEDSARGAAPEYSAKTSGRDSASASMPSAMQQRPKELLELRGQQYLCNCSRRRPRRPLPRQAAIAWSALRKAQPRPLSRVRAAAWSTSESPPAASPASVRRSSEAASNTSKSSSVPGRSGSVRRKASSQTGGSRCAPPLTRFSTHGGVAKGRICTPSLTSACHGSLRVAVMRR